MFRWRDCEKNYSPKLEVLDKDGLKMDIWLGFKNAICSFIVTLLIFQSLVII